MFFSKKKIKANEAAITASIDAQKEVIKQRLNEVGSFSAQLQEEVLKTQVASFSIMSKLKHEFKIAKKSLTSICQKMVSGVVIVDHDGGIIALNQAAATLFDVEADAYIGQDLNELISSIDPVGPLKPLQVDKTYFSQMSELLFERLSCDCKDNCTTEERLKEVLPPYFDIDKDVKTVLTTTSKKKITINMAFSVLNNDPEHVNDVTYIFFFRTPAKA